MSQSRTEQKLRLQALQIVAIASQKKTVKTITLSEMMQLAEQIIEWSRQCQEQEKSPR